MMEWIIVILVVAIVLMAAYIRGLWSRLADEEKESSGLSRELEAKQLEVYAANDAVERAQLAYNAIFDIVSKQLDINLDIAQVSIWQECLSSDIADATMLSNSIASKLEEMRKEAESGNRAELVTQLRAFYKEICSGEIDFDAFMAELGTMPQAAANRIIVSVMVRY